MIYTHTVEDPERDQSIQYNRTDLSGPR